MDTTAPKLSSTLQKWKIDDHKAQKTGQHRTVYWVKPKKTAGSDAPLSKLDKNSYTTDSVYQGEWLDNLKHGFGTQVWANGNKYEGEWARGKREGHGVMWIMEDGQLRKTYAGNWKDGLREGLGVQFYKNGDRYEGEWLRGQRCGQGSMFYTSGDVYVGQWRDDQRAGSGTLTKANEDVYEGQWLADKKEGPGIYYFKSKQKILDGEWVADVAKCGIYTSAAEYFDDVEEKHSAGGESKGVDINMLGKLKKKEKPLPELQWHDGEGILAQRIQEIAKERLHVRTLATVPLESILDADVADDLRVSFSVYDSAGTGKISCTELQHVWNGAAQLPVSRALTEQDTAHALAELGHDGTSPLDFRTVAQATYIVLQRLAEEDAREAGSNADD